MDFWFFLLVKWFSNLAHQKIESGSLCRKVLLRCNTDSKLRRLWQREGMLFKSESAEMFRLAKLMIVKAGIHGLVKIDLKLSQKITKTVLKWDVA